MLVVALAAAGCMPRTPTQVCIGVVVVGCRMTVVSPPPDRAQVLRALLAMGVTF